MFGNILFTTYLYLAPLQNQPPEVFYKKGVLKNSHNNTCVVVFFNKVASLRPEATLLRKILRHGCFPVNFAKFLRMLILNTFERLLLPLGSSNNICLMQHYIICEMINLYKGNWN